MNVVMMGASGAVGSQVVNTLLEAQGPIQLTLLGRRQLELPADIAQHNIDVFRSESYREFLKGAGLEYAHLGWASHPKRQKLTFCNWIKLRFWISQPSVSRQALSIFNCYVP